jgi:hypothetical protein
MRDQGQASMGGAIADPYLSWLHAAPPFAALP